MSTPQNDEPALEKLRDEYLKQLLDRYEARSGRFRSVLFGFVGFGTVFVLLVLIPFASLRRQYHAVSGQLRNLQDRAENLTVAVEAYGKATQGFRTLQSTIDKGAKELRDALPALLSSQSMESSIAQTNAHIAQQNVQQQLPNQPPRPSSLCDSIPDSEERMNCRVAEYVRTQFARYAHVLDTAVLEPIEHLPEGTEGRPDPNKLQAGLRGLQSAFEERLRSTPRFWEHYSGKIDFFSELRHDLDRYWKEHGFQSQEDALVAAKKTVDSNLANLKTRKTALESQERGLAARLAQIESPLGKLPIGLIEAVQIFPLLIAMGFGWCWAVLMDLAGIRRALRTGYREWSPDQVALTDRHLSVIAPLWLGENSGMQDRFARLALSAQLVIYLIGCALVIYLWLGGADAGDMSVRDRWLYGTLYLLSAIGLIIASRNMFDLVREVRGGVRS